MSIQKKSKNKKKTEGADCRDCNGLCCRYFALPIDTPKTWKDYDDIRWYLSHRGVSVFVEKGDWYLQVDNRCKYLDRSHRCRQYPLRPRICRTYHTGDCEKAGDDYGYELHFLNDRQMAEYMRSRFGVNVFQRLEKIKVEKTVRRKGRS
ncbi:MAG TPA: YkgJ family cysteine cluster protein [Anaerohalosphaeraceae bacterium]|nr:YkgJ family cysteine cluster protein [Anaerohalosphaeraceae bacterium]HOL89773.1 YkgJ family cysteine cluster protein [Anaerohalosphaeraceae bacterium]HPP57318.1 YkgJ family cysteine cluster protein [Anaerohalosphaeraceae bacterium]